MSNEVDIIEQLTKHFLEEFGPEKGVAILSSVVCGLYQETNKENAMVLAQPAAEVMVITTTFDAVDQIGMVVEKTLEQMPSILKEIEADLEGTGLNGALEAVNGNTGERKEFDQSNVTDIRPKNKTLH